LPPRTSASEGAATHLRRIFATLGVTSRAAMVTTIFKRGKL